jgi:hypothetical protein
MTSPNPQSLPAPTIVGFVGNYGSGKTEVAVNYAVQLAASDRPVAIADLDLVNPYFRCREALELLEERGIRVVVPRGANRYAELPIMLPEVKGLLSATGQTTILDVGGDDVGARALSHLAAEFPPPGDGGYQLWQVINQSRPFTDTVEGCLAMREKIEGACRLRITGLVANTHLMDETTAEIVEKGYQFTREVGKAADLPVVMVAVTTTVYGDLATADIACPVLVIDRQMTPPWVDDSASLGWAGERERLRLIGG